MKDIICVGGVTHDIYLKSKFKEQSSKLIIPWGEKIVVEDMEVGLGGGGANAAVGFARQGLATALLARIGAGHISQSVVDKLTGEKVATTWLIKDTTSHTATSVILLDSASGERTIVMYRGRNDFFDIEALDIGKLLDTRWLYIADLAASDDRNSFVGNITQAAAERQISIAFTPAKRQLELGLKQLKPAFERCQVVIMNQSEWDTLTGGMPDSKAHTVGAPITVITRDTKGVTVCTKDQCLVYPAPKVSKVVDTTGAGDAFAAGFIGALVKKRSLETAVAWGTANAGSVIASVSAQGGLLHKEQLELILP